MKATVLTASISRAGGGVSESARRVTQVVARQEGVEFEVFGLDDSFSSQDRACWQPIQPQSFAVRGPRAYGYAPGLAPALDESGADLAHVHGIWTYPTLAASNWARRNRNPYLVTIHGMMDPWAMNNSRLKKRLVLALFEERVLRQAACLHVLNEPELQSVRALGFRNPVCMIPNGVDLPDEPPACPPPWSGFADGRKVMLYLGRIHPKKGLLNLLNALSRLRQRGHPGLEEWLFVVAGWSQGTHEDELKAQVKSADLDSLVRFVGPQFGDAKAAAFHHADAFVLPSLSEGLPMAILEAWAHRLPVVMTPECNLAVGFETRSAIRVETGVESLANGVADLFLMPESDRKEMGQRGRALVEARFTWGQAATEMRRVYEWMTGGGPMPAAIHQSA